MKRMEEAFRVAKKARRAAFIPYITAGDPNLEATVELVRGLARAGADIIELGRFGATSRWPWAADARALYVWRRDGIEAWAGGDPIVIAETEAPKFASAAVDDDYLYWADEGRIHYVDKEGGPIQTLVDGDASSSEVRALTTDGCGVYYSVVNPPRVMVVSVP